MQDVLAKLKAIQENYDNEDIQRAITAAKKTAVAEEQVNEDSYDHTSDDGHQIKDVTDYDDYDGYSVKLETPLGSVEAEWNSQGGRGFFGGIRASNRTLESMIGKIYGEMHDFESMDKMDWPVAVGMAVDKVMSMAKDNPSFMRSESVEKVNEYYVKSAEDVLNTYPLFSYRKSNPSVDTLYKSFQKWLATGNELTPDQIEALDQAAEEVEYIEPENKEEMKEMLKKQYKVLSDIIKGNKTESVEKVNEYYVKSAKDVLNTLPAFAYRASDPVDDQPEDKMYTAAVGDRAEMLYNKLRKWLAAGNDFSPEEIEALDQAASGPEFIGLRGDADDQDVIDMLNSGLDTLEDIIGDKTESVQEGDAELEELKSALGRTGGVMGFKN